MTKALLSHNIPHGLPLLPSRGGPCIHHTPPQAALSSLCPPHPSSRSRSTCLAVECSAGSRPSNGAGSTGRRSAGAGTPAPRARVVAGAVGTSDAPAPYKWSWQDDSEPAAALELAEPVVAAACSVQDLTEALRAAAAAAPPRAALTTPSRSALAAAAERVLLLLPLPGGASPSTSTEPPEHPTPLPPSPPVCSVADAARLLEAYGAVSQGTIVSIASGGGGDAVATSSEADAPQAAPLAVSVLSHICSIAVRSPAAPAAATAAVLHSASARDLADLLWALSELQEYDLPWDERSTVAAEAPAALQRAVLARLREQDFLAPDLCRAVCALGCLVTASAGPQPASTSGTQPAAGGRGGFVPVPEVVAALNEEIRYQLTEFDADFEAADLGRLISGMAGLRLGSAVAGDAEYRRILMKAVYGKTRSIADKGAVDFALSRLMNDDPEARSMHFDTRWTHEELNWLPRRERDKRRIIKEGWHRTQWGGWSGGGARR